MKPKKILLIINNINEAMNEKNTDFDQVIFAPQYLTPVQKNFFTDDIFFIKQVFPESQFLKQKEVLDLVDSESEITVSIWNSYYENIFVNKLKAVAKQVFLLKENRLFDEFEVKPKQSFSSFRKTAELKLQVQYKDSYQYWDEDLDNRLNYYFVNNKWASSYFETRNQLDGPSFSTQLSPFLSSGALNVRYLYNFVKKYEANNGANKSTYWIVFELLWREFFYHSGIKNGCALFAKEGLCSSQLNLKKPKMTIDQTLDLFSGHEFMQAAFNQLRTVGFLSNRVRQLFASVFIYDLNLDWRLGAELFERYLIDFDVFSNYGNWQYIAGVGLDPRGGRQFNLTKQLSTYDPGGTYIQYWKYKSN